MLLSKCKRHHSKVKSLWHDVESVECIIKIFCGRHSFALRWKSVEGSHLHNSNVFQGA